MGEASRIDYYTLNRRGLPRTAVGKSSLELTRAIKNLYGTLIVSPLFLLFSTVVFLFLPDEALKGNIKENLASFLVRALKSAVDVVISLLGIVLLSPLFLIIALIIKIDSRGPILYKQVRIGQNRRVNGLDRRRLSVRVRGERRNNGRRNFDHLGCPFTIYKFRTMKDNAEEDTGPVWAAENDPRVTKVGRILRVTRLDEIPQLLNVMKGEMSLVGPRPERPYFVDKLKEQIPEYFRRFEIKPGITGLAQVRHKYDSSLDDARKKVRYDLFYLENRSVLLDLKILLSTAKTSLLGEGAH